MSTLRTYRKISPGSRHDFFKIQCFCLDNDCIVMNSLTLKVGMLKKNENSLYFRN